MKLNIKKLLAIVIVVSTLSIVAVSFVVRADTGVATMTATNSPTGYWQKNNIYDWTVSKTASPTSTSISSGATATINYAIDAKRTLSSTNENKGVSGVLSVTNNGFMATANLMVTDNIQYKVGDYLYQTQLSTDIDTSAHPVLAAGETYAYPYNIPFTPADGVIYKNEATVIAYYPGNALMPFRLEPAISEFTMPSNLTLNETDTVASVQDSTNCPAGFKCTPLVTSWILNDSQSITKSVAVTNVSAVCDQISAIGSYTILAQTDTGIVKNSSAIVNINGVCRNDGNYGTGYWAEHSGETSQKDDVVTQYLPIYLGNLKVDTATQARDILTTKASNGVDKLKAQLLAAKLNIASGARGMSIIVTVSAADSFLTTTTSDGWSSLTKIQQQQVLGWMTSLDSYNNNKK